MGLDARAVSPRLAYFLRQAREQRKLTGEAVASRLGWSPAKVSRYEHGKTGVSRADLLRLLGLYKVPEEERRKLILLAADTPGQLDATSAAYLEADEILEWAPLVIPAVLQAPDYAVEVLRSVQDLVQMLPSAVENEASSIRLWRERLTAPRPLLLQAVIDEACLHRQVGSPGCMQQQLEYLISASDLRNVDLRVLPWNAPRPYSVSGFSYLRFVSPGRVTEQGVVVPDGLPARQLVDAEGEAYRCYRAFGQLQRAALSEAGSREVLKHVHAETWPET